MRIRALVFTFVVGLVGCDSSSSTPPPLPAQTAPAATPAPTAPAPVAPAPIAPAPIVPANTVQLTGRVTNAGQPVAGAMVVPSDRSDGLVPAGISPTQLLTGPDGRFAIDLPAGDYDVRVVGEGCTCQVGADLTQGSRDVGDLAISENPRAILDMVNTGSPR